MASKKRHLPKEEPEAKKPKLDDDVVANNEKQRVVLNPADCDLDFDIQENGLKGSAFYKEGFAYCWSGARANVGITRGKYCFSCKIVSVQPVNMEDTAPDQQHVCRLVISRGDDAVGNLGETKHSFGFGGTGKFSTAGKFLNYGEKFGVGDTIVCAVDLESKPLASIGFFKNGKWLGTAMQFDAGLKGLSVIDSPMRKQQWESALFPHILLKNVVALVQFSIEEGLDPVQGFEPWALALDNGNAVMGPTFPSPRECEVMMMVGLPASGKTTWAEKWVKEHPEKRYVLIGTNLILDQMKVTGLLRKHNYGERFDRLMVQASAMFDSLLSRAASTRRNYIIDQTNVFKSARKRKLRPFASFRKIAVVVFPKPDELKFRSDKRFKEMGKEVPADAVNNMLANYVLPVSKDTPGSDELFDQVMFVELDRGESQRYLNEMKCTLGSASNSTSNLKSVSTPPSRESVVDAYIRPVAGRHWQSSLPPSPPPFNYGFQIPHHVNSAFQGGGSGFEVYQGYQNPTLPTAPVPYGTYPSNERSSIPIENSGYSGSYGSIPGGGTDPYQNSAFQGLGSGSGVYQGYRNPALPTAPAPYGTYPSNERSSIPIENSGYSGSYGTIPRGVTDPHQSYEVVDPYSRSNFDAKNTIPGAATDHYWRSMVQPSAIGSARTSSFAHNAYGGQIGVIGGPQADLQAPRAPANFPIPLPTAYGSPYGTVDLRPSNINFPADMQHFRGYAHPHPWYN